jgi:hypothetical protein
MDNKLSVEQTEIMTTIVEQIDDIKELVPDQIYINIMNTLTKINESYKTPRLKDNILTELWYKLRQHKSNVRLMFTEGNGYHPITISPGCVHRYHSADIHMVIEGVDIESFANEIPESSKIYPSHLISIPTEDEDFVVTVTLGLIDDNTADRITVVIHTDRRICDVSKFYIIDYLIDYIHYLSDEV